MLWADDHIDRVDGINALVTEAIETILADDPDAIISEIDYPDWIGETGGPRDIELRDDGVHLTQFGLDEIAPWLIEEMGLT